MKTVFAKATFSTKAREIVRKFGWRGLFERATRNKPAPPTKERK
jgi:hypothetical protein